MNKARVAGDFLPWRDVLHEGPVPGGLTLGQLSKIRAEYISSKGWGSADEIHRAFIQRDDMLRASSLYRKVILWFEHDLYDQLQILQILDWFAEHGAADTELSIICTDQYLGMQTPSEIPGLLQYEEIVSNSQLTLANKAWAAFRAESPQDWYALLSQDTSALPFLEGAVGRLLQEYPACKNGLSRTAHQALQIISKGETHPGQVFALYQKTEERRFMGDSSFWTILRQLLSSSPALLSLSGADQLTLPAGSEQLLQITAAGEEVLAGKKDWLEMEQLDRWHGGVHLTESKPWCWEKSASGIHIRPGQQ